MINNVPRRKDRGIKVQGWTAHYEKWVLAKLIELELETSENALVGRIVHEWVERNSDKHRGLGLTPEAFLKERQPGGAKLYNFTRHQSDVPDNDPEAIRHAG